MRKEDRKVEQEILEFIFANGFKSKEYRTGNNECEEWHLPTGTYYLNGEQIQLSAMNITIRKSQTTNMP